MKKTTIAGAAVAAVAGPLMALGLTAATAFADASGYCGASANGCNAAANAGALCLKTGILILGE